MTVIILCRQTVIHSPTLFRPWTRQTGSCGQPGPGDFISVPLDFVATWNSTADTAAGAAKLLAHEFVKLRLAGEIFAWN